MGILKKKWWCTKKKREEIEAKWNAQKRSMEWQEEWKNDSM